MASYKRSCRSSFSDQNTPDNNQDSQTTEEISRYITKECTHQLESRSTTTTDVVAEEVLEEEPMEEEPAAKFSETIYKGECFRRASDFDDSECGEPVRPQHLRLDFSPVEGVDDNEYIMNKCRNFWTFIESNPKLKGLMALPDKIEPKVNSTKTVSVKSEPKAMDWLKHEEELLSKAFVTKRRIRLCEDGRGENCENWETKRGGKKILAGSSGTAVRSVSRSRRVLEPLGSENQHSTEDLAALCMQLEQWDLLHPKSMEPPSHPPSLSHALMQSE